MKIKIKKRWKPRKQRALKIRKKEKKRKKKESEILISCDANGEIFIKTTKHSKKVLRWLDKYRNKPASYTVITLDSSVARYTEEYLKSIFTLLSPLIDILTFEWKYKKDDEKTKQMIEKFQENSEFGKDLNIEAQEV